MAREVAFLRAVNVGGHGSLKMTDLKRIFESAGCGNVQTVIASGNVVFDPPRTGKAAGRRRIQEELSRILGNTAVVIYRTGNELEGLLAESPFGPLESGPDVKLYVAFLAALPKVVPPLPLTYPKDGLEMTRVTGAHVFIVRRRIAGRPGVPNIPVEKIFAVPATIRDWNTVTRIAELSRRPR